MFYFKGRGTRNTRKYNILETGTEEKYNKVIEELEY